jgi:hypothetical protein
MKCWDCLELIFRAERRFVLILVDNCSFSSWLDIIYVCLLYHSTTTVVIAVRRVCSLEMQIIVNVNCEDKSKLQISLIFYWS